MKYGVVLPIWQLTVAEAASLATRAEELGLDGVFVPDHILAKPATTQHYGGHWPDPFSLLAYLAGRADFSVYLGIPHVPRAGELAILCAGIMGACLAFLWFNAPPAAVFMGDTGSLALGGALGAIAVAATLLRTGNSRMRRYHSRYSCQSTLGIRFMSAKACAPAAMIISANPTHSPNSWLAWRALVEEQPTNRRKPGCAPPASKSIS